MSMQITVDPENMSLAQREAISNFIKTFPTKGSMDNLTVKLSIDTKEAREGLEALAQQAAEVSPESAFGTKVEVVPSLAVGQIVTSDIPGLPPVATIVAVSGGVDIDKNGFPWDSRIHSSNKAKVADGTWRKRRGIDDATIAQVEAELRAVMGAPAATIAPTAQITIDPPAVVVPPPPADPNAMPPIPASMVRTAPVVPAAPVTPNVGGRDAFVALVGRTSAAIHQKKITQEQVTACCTKYGVPALPLLANRLDLVPQVAAEIDALLGT